MARNVVQMDVDVSRAERKLKKLQAGLAQEAHASVKELAELGKFYARARAPYYSGKTFRGITLRNGRDEFEAQIFVLNPTANDGHRRNIPNFNLVRWMHQSSKARKHIKSGDRRFMYTTRDYLKQVAPVKVNTRYNRLVVKINNS